MRNLYLIIFTAILFYSIQIRAQQYITDHTIAFESVLRDIPVEYISTVRNNLHIAYQHTSHETHVSYGIFGLPRYKYGDENEEAPSQPDTLFSESINWI